MGTRVKEGGERTLTPAGLHRARCCWVIDLGSVENKAYGKIQSKVMLGWELLDQSIVVNDKPTRPIFKHKYTASLDSRAVLRQHLDSWRGIPFTDEELKKTGFELKNVLGAVCYLQIMHEKGNDGTIYANLKSIMPLPPGSPEAPPLMTRNVFFDMDERTPVPEGLPPWLLAEIAKSPEWSKNYSGGDDGGGPGADGSQLSGLQEAMLEAEARGLGTACGLQAAHVSTFISDAKAKGVLPELVATYRRTLDARSVDPFNQEAAPPPLPADAGDLIDEIYDMAELLGSTRAETKALVAGAKGKGELQKLHAAMTLQLSKGQP
jgi:hypothetical protein